MYNTYLAGSETEKMRLHASGGLSLGNGYTGTDAGAGSLIISGNVGIGTTNPVHLLQVAGTIGAEEVIVSSTGADYVFEPEYHLSPLSEVSAYIKANHHLTEIPSAAEVQDKGVNLGEMQSKLLAKIEELTLHMIQAERENSELRDRVFRLEREAASKTK